MQSLGPRFAEESVLQLDAGERAPGHHGIVAPAGAVRVELPRSQAERKKRRSGQDPPRSRVFCLDLTQDKKRPCVPRLLHLPTRRHQLYAAA